MFFNTVNILRVFNINILRVLCYFSNILDVFQIYYILEKHLSKLFWGVFLQVIFIDIIF